jgi:shikimate kinase
MPDDERRERLTEMLEERRESYESAEIVVDTDGCGPEVVAQLVLERLTQRERERARTP